MSTVWCQIITITSNTCEVSITQRAVGRLGVDGVGMHCYRASGGEAQFSCGSVVYTSRQQRQNNIALGLILRLFNPPEPA